MLSWLNNIENWGLMDSLCFVVIFNGLLVFLGLFLIWMKILSIITQFSVLNIDAFYLFIYSRVFTCKGSQFPMPKRWTLKAQTMMELYSVIIYTGDFRKIVKWTRCQILSFQCPRDVVSQAKLVFFMQIQWMDGINKCCFSYIWE